MLGAVDAATIIRHHSTYRLARIVEYQWIATEFDNVTISAVH
jgi:hypothetical protein